ncbi:MAG: hypothetical protein ACRETB_04460, partial [Steroidobacteraceae bacterium]
MSTTYLKWMLAAAVLVLAVAAAALGARQLHHDRLARQLLAAPPAQAGADPVLVRFAVEEAKPLFADHCAACHGADMRGTTA